MDKEYIERDMVLSHKWEVRVYDPSDPDPVTEVVSVSSIMRIPAADVRPVVRGKWEEVEVEHAADIDQYPDLVTMCCGKCKRYHTTLFYYGNPTALMNYCPVCGADMREES